MRLFGPNFDEASLRLLEERYPDAILVSDEDGAVFGLNGHKRP